mmetsp:Transcript_21752/g.51346  ORF Transcript_21752/g.51346 Transcript_21752/m.51346 type:complete len:309 (+) Transcript_21752:139-1065(+)|eukprot:CAMPEP_0113451718 /NCGR_PEP_ID=MMETSP0014_2-20120614/6481_1 /TAXON_ID=2857 /ORGANISM="Nitzschia sp." /LENGTH=308 /DNA_ID=CAMNT_0000343079 /DNA_START=2049 /DNA_END=2975 /DNA_ORIENTATION=+ /assembly_acc=CAM_ASM_000159
MPPKTKAKGGGASKKNEQKKKQKAIEDKTFGLKNKNKSKKVQQYVQGVKNSVLNTNARKERELEEKRKKQKAEQKMRKKAMEEERNLLFNEALGALKKKGPNFKEGKSATEAKGRDHDDGTEKKGTSRAMKMMYQMDAKEMEQRLREDPNYVPTLEDKIEAERQQKVEELKKSGKGTPVTPETFAAWQDKKRKRRAEEAKKMVEAELKKKKGGKGLAVLSGRALYEYKQDLFNVSDDGDGDGDDDDGAATVENGTTGGQNQQQQPPPSSSSVEKQKDGAGQEVEKVAEKVQSDLFLDGDDDDLDDLED